MAAGRAVHAVPALPDAITGPVNRPGWLEDWRLAAAVTAVGIALLAAWSWTAVRDHRRGRRRPHRVLRRVVLSGATVLTLLTGVGLAANSYAGYAPDAGTLVRAVPSLLGYRSTGGDTADPGAAVPGRSRPRLISITLADRADRIPPGRDWVYLPAGYDDPANAHRRYPVAYLIHGYPSSSYDWFGAGRAGRTAGLMQRHGLMAPMILVSPDATGGTRHDTECLNSSVGGPQLETFLTTTLVRTIDRDYRTIPDRADRIIGGVSSGAFCALNLGLRHQAEFGTILSLMPAGDPGVNAVRFMFGGDARLGRLNSPSWYAATLPLRHPQFIFLSASVDDRDATATARSLARTLAARDVFTAVRIDPPGLGHTWREARRQIPYAFAFATAHLGRARAGTAAPPPLGLGAAWAADAWRSGTQPARTARSYKARTSAPK